MFTTSSQQSVTNIQNRLEKILFDEQKTWESHVLEFMAFIDEITSYGQEVSDTEKVTKIIRSLQQSFKPLDMVSTMTNMSLDDIVKAV